MFCSTIPAIFILSLFYWTSLVYANPQFIVNRFDIEEGLQYDIETGTPYKNCGGSKSILKSVELTPCDEISSGHCVLRRGTNVTCNLSFESEENSTTLTAKVFGIIAFVPVPFPCPQVSRIFLNNFQFHWSIFLNAA